MHESAGLAARLGAVALMISLPVPWFGHSFGPVSINYSLWDLSNAAAGGLFVFAVLAMVQLNIGKGLTGPMWTIAGASLAAYLCYRLFTPPTVFTSELFDGLNLNVKPRPGVYLAIAGAGAISYGGILQMRFEASRAAGGNPHPNAREVAHPASAARYVAPPAHDPFARTPGAGQAAPPAPRVPGIPPDPFAPHPPAPPDQHQRPPAA